MQTLSDAAQIVGVLNKTLSKHLDEVVKIKGCTIKRVIKSKDGDLVKKVITESVQSHSALYA